MQIIANNHLIPERDSYFKKLITSNNQINEISVGYSSKSLLEAVQSDIL